MNKSPLVVARDITDDIGQWADDYTALREAVYAIEEEEARPARLAFMEAMVAWGRR